MAALFPQAGPSLCLLAALALLFPHVLYALLGVTTYRIEIPIAFGCSLPFPSPSLSFLASLSLDLQFSVQAGYTVKLVFQFVLPLLREFTTGL